MLTLFNSEEIPKPVGFVVLDPDEFEKRAATVVAAARKWMAEPYEPGPGYMTAPLDELLDWLEKHPK